MKPTPKILLVEDEEALGLIIKDSLVHKGFEVLYTSDASLAYHVYEKEKPDLMVLDVMLPKVSGLQIAEKIRIHDQQTPILFLTARTMPSDVLNGYQAGGNDYLKKPFDMQELIVRIKVLLNQNRLLTDENNIQNVTFVTIGDYSFDIMRNQLLYKGIVKKLTAREGEVLKVLYQHRNRLLNRKDFLIQIWGDDDFFSSRSLDVYITKIRRHLKQDSMVQLINHRGFGYKLVC